MYYYTYSNLVVFVPDENGNDPWSPVRIDTIDRFNQGSAGSGDVYIAHAESFPTEKDVHIFKTPASWPRTPVYGTWFIPHDRKPFLARALGDGSMFAKYDNGNGTCDIFVQHIEYDPTLSKRYGKPYANNWNDSFRRFCTFAEVDQYIPSYMNRILQRTPSPEPLSSVDGYVARKSDVKLSFTSQLDSYLASREFGLQSSHRSGIDNGLFYKSYYDAIEKLPALQQNTLANIAEIINTLRSFADGFDMTDLRSVKRTSRDLWLRYRYQYRTTISDMEEVTNAVARLQAIVGKPISTYGSANKNGVTTTCQVKVVVPEISSINDFILAANLRPTLSNVWDVIPYSFVVDWFFKVGPFLEDLQSWIDSPIANITEVWYSVWQSREDKDLGLTVREYGRWSGKPPALPYFTEHNVGARTIGLRVADAIALFV